MMIVMMMMAFTLGLSIGSKCISDMLNRPSSSAEVVSSEEAQVERGKRSLNRPLTNVILLVALVAAAELQ